MIIYKYELNIDDIQRISMPLGAEILSAGTQGEKVFLWAGVNPAMKKEDRIFMVVGTGHASYNERVVKFIDTVFAGVFVWHIFEVVK